MAQTVSELEKERAQLLEAIESQAQTMSTKRSSNEEAVEHTLNDWLNAAEEIMPAKKTARRQKSSATSSAPLKSKNNKASFFGVIIMLSLLLTVLGVLYIAYTSIHNELQKVLEGNTAAMQEVKSIQDTVTRLEESVASGGQGDLFVSLQERVAQLESEISALKAQQVALESSASQKQTTKTSPNASNIAAALNVDPKKLVTSEELDRKLNNYTQQINEKLEKIMLRLSIPAQAKAEPSSKMPETENAAVSSLLPIPEQPTMELPEPTVVAPSVKPLNQPVVRLVAESKQPKVPAAPAAPLKNYSPEVKWLMQEPSLNHTLQLASMSERSALQSMIDKKGLSGAKIIPQERNGKTQYVLISGSYADRKEAEAAARTYQSQHKISPWIRKIKDLSSKVK